MKYYRINICHVINYLSSFNDYIKSKKFNIIITHDYIGRLRLEVGVRIKVPMQIFTKKQVRTYNSNGCLYIFKIKF